MEAERIEEPTARFQKTADFLNAGNTAYLDARRNPVSGKKTARDLIAAAADEIGSTLGARLLQGFGEWLLNDAGKVSISTLNAASLACIQAENWDLAKRLANAVNSVDHHDLLAQRLHDAAAIESSDLSLPVDDWLKDKFCKAPFEQIETRANETVHFCCSAWQPVPIGKLDQKPDRVWNSDVAKEIRRSILDGDYTYCSRWHCPMISGRRLRKLEQMGASSEVMTIAKARNASEKSDTLSLKQTPNRAILSHDRSCNLSCPSCRTKVIQINREQSAELDNLINKDYADFLSAASRIKVTGSGDPFASRHFLSFLKHFTATNTRAQRLQLHTNGLLLDEATWNRLDLWGHVDSIWISVDAAEAETYSVVRRGGTFKRLLSNLRFLGNMRRAGAFSKLRLDFVVQKRNFREVPSFASLAQHVGANGVYFLRLRNWGTFTQQEFEEQNVCDPGHPDHPELLSVLADQRLRSPSVELGSLRPFVREALDRQQKSMC
ncbi:radical SAM protein [uncultured Roseibium sp.]|uniref:radical SAM protein n=1 Tax=uncultured Roseibium sp. TaxID=1936171 RepID=UPI00260F49E5|nr:radical SAM protein [uncultured Roseibium sp.]